jgi:hypothetical protein
MASDDERDRIAEALAHLDELDRARIAALAVEIDRSARAPVREILRIWSRAGGDTRIRAAGLLSELSDLSMIPLLEIADPEDPLRRVWRLRHLTATQLSLRASIFEVLADSLEDERIVEYPSAGGPRPDERAPPERVCDVAYKQLRELFHVKETQGERVLTEDAFDRLGFAEKDREIEAFTKTRTWSNFEGVEPEGD